MTLPELMALRAKATAGEWKFYENDWNSEELNQDVSSGSIIGGDGWYIVAFNGQPKEPEDIAFIIAAHNSLPAIAEHVAALERENAELRAQAVLKESTCKE
jgi:hypothetical protein